MTIIRNKKPAIPIVINESVGYAKTQFNLSGPSSDEDLNSVFIAYINNSVIDAEKNEVFNRIGDPITVIGLTPGTNYTLRMASLDDFIASDLALVRDLMVTTNAEVLDYYEKPQSTLEAPVILTAINEQVEKGAFYITNLTIQYTGNLGDEPVLEYNDGTGWVQVEYIDVVDSSTLYSIVPLGVLDIRLRGTKAHLDYSIELSSGSTVTDLDVTLEGKSWREILQEDLDNLNDNTLPALEDTIEDVKFDTGGIDELLEGVSQHIIELTERKEVETSVDKVNSELDTLNGETLPQLQSDLNQAELDLLEIDNRFPITETNISDGSISTPKLQANSITAIKIISGAVTTNKMTANSINGDRIAVNTLAADKIIANSITANQIAANAVTANEIKALTITATEIATNTITASQIAANTITAGQIAANTVTANEIKALTITAAEIASRTISGDKIVANAISANEIAANAIYAGAIQTDAVTAIKIAAGAITADKISAGAVTAAKIDAGAVTANKIDAGAVTAVKLSADAIDGKTITGVKVIGGTFQSIGTNTMIVTSGTPFGPDNLLEWKGAVSGNISGGEAILGNLTKVNAIGWVDDQNNQYTSGTIIAGTLTVSKQSTSLDNNPWVETGMFNSNGGQIAIQSSFFGSKSNGLQTGNCPVPARPNPTVTMRLYRLEPNGTVLVAQESFTGEYTCTDEGPEYVESWQINGSMTFYDNLETTQNRNYRLEATVNDFPVLPDGTQRLSILTQEA